MRETHTREIKLYRMSGGMDGGKVKYTTHLNVCPPLNTGIIPYILYSRMFVSCLVFQKKMLIIAHA